MLVLVCGSRDWKDEDAIRERLRQLPRGTKIIHGGARGADAIAGAHALTLGFAVREFPADWKGLGRSAGYRRNIAMLDEQPDLVLAFWKDDSTGTGHTVREARRRGIPTEVIDPDAKFILRIPCLACNREPGTRLCVLCTLIEEAERKVGDGSPEVTVVLR